MSTQTPSIREDLIYFVSCALNGVPADRQRAENADLTALYKAAERHMLTALTAQALESAGIRDEAFTQAKSKAVRKAVVFDADQKDVQECLNAAGIWHMPLKGAVIKGLYPFLGARQMSDIDILFDPSRAQDVRDIMLKLGFVSEGFGAGAHDVYKKPPVSNFEMHRKLFAETVVEKIADYYENVKSRLIPDGGSSFGYHFSSDDLYVYLTCHEYKHFSNSGTGLRSLADTYVFMQKRGNSLNREYIQKELEKLGVSEFEQSTRELALRLFGGEELAEKDREILDYIMSSGTYGTVKNSVDHKVRALGGGTVGRIRYFLRRAFLPMDTVRSSFPLFAKVPILLPFLPLYRLSYGLTSRRKKMKAELKALFSGSKKQGR